VSVDEIQTMTCPSLKFQVVCIQVAFLTSLHDHNLSCLYKHTNFRTALFLLESISSVVWYANNCAVVIVRLMTGSRCQNSRVQDVVTNIRFGDFMISNIITYIRIINHLSPRYSHSCHSFVVPFPYTLIWLWTCVWQQQHLNHMQAIFYRRVEICHTSPTLCPWLSRIKVHV